MNTPKSTRRSFHAPGWMIGSRRPVSITLIGAGGTGGEVLDQLCRLHATLRALDHSGLSVTLYDGDTVSASNVGRQRFSALDVGQFKANVLINRINLFYGLNWQGIPADWTASDHLDDFVISATDSAAVRHEIATAGVNDELASWHSRSHQRLWLDFGNGRTEGQAVLGHLNTNGDESNNLRLPHIIDFYPDMIDNENDSPSCSVAEALRSQAFGVNATLVTSAFSTLIWPLFRQGSIDRHGLFMDVAEGSVQPLHVDPMEWSLMGYIAPRAARQSDNAPTMD